VHDERFGEELRHLPRVLAWDEERALELLRRIAVPTAQLKDSEGLPAHVSPVLLSALYAALKVPHDFRAAMRLLLRAGGEVDAAAALLGGILGAHLGTAALPSRLRKSVLYAEQLENAAVKLASARIQSGATVFARAAARRQGA
jgi:ADP-ribosylglycohydrolase